MNRPITSEVLDALFAAKRALDEQPVRATMLYLGDEMAAAWDVEPGFYRRDPVTGQWEYAGYEWGP